MTEIVSTTVRLPKDLHEKLTKIAEDERRSFNSQVIYMLEKGVSEHERQRKQRDA